MEFLAWLIILACSLLILEFSAEKLIDASAKLAKTLGVSGTVIGLTILAYGSSFPEFIVSTVASFRKVDQLSVSNIVGSNIFNIAFIIGAMAVVAPIRCRDRELCLRDGVMMTFSTVALSILILSGGVSRFAGLAMLITMLGYILFLTKSTNNHQPSDPSGLTSKWEGKVPLVMVLAFLGVPTSGYLVVASAAALARLVGVSDWLIGATVVAAGTSLPEFAISIVAAKKGEAGLSLGNIVGSNIFNILLILGSSALISPKAVSFYAVSTDVFLLITLTLWLQLSLVRGRITRLEGLGVLTLYAGYILHLTGRFPITHWPLIG